MKSNFGEVHHNKGRRLRLRLLVLMVIFTFIAFALFYNGKEYKSEELYCKMIATTEDNEFWTWQEIKIGISTKKDMIDSLGQPDIITTFYYEENNTSGIIYSYIINDSFARLIIVNDLVIAVEPNSTGYFLGFSDVTLHDLNSSYGYPQLIGFSNIISYSRTAVWPEKGIQAVINIFDPNPPPSLISDPELARVTNIQYFCPMSKAEYLNSYISGWYTDTRPGGDVIDLFPMNPFGWDNK